jgi:hypothetical protein
VLLSGVRTSFFLNNLQSPTFGIGNSDYSGSTIIYASTPSMDEQCPLCLSKRGAKWESDQEREREKGRLNAGHGGSV